MYFVNRSRLELLCCAVALTVAGCVQFDATGLGSEAHEDDRAHGQAQLDEGSSETTSAGPGDSSRTDSGTQGANDDDASWTGAASTGGASSIGATATGATSSSASESSHADLDTTATASGGQEDTTGADDSTSGDTSSSEASSGSEDGVIPGSLAFGEACEHPEQCRSGHCPRGPDTSLEGACSECSVDADCARGLCRIADILPDIDLRGRSCELSEVGEACHHHEDCLAGSLCDSSDGSLDASGRCQVCIVDADCPSELYCDDRDAQGLRDCQPRGSRELGESCPMRDGVGLHSACRLRICHAAVDDSSSGVCGACLTDADCEAGSRCQWRAEQPDYRSCGL